MPSEQSTSSNARPRRTGPAERGQHSPITGSVRGLLGLPMRESGPLPTAPLTAPAREHHYGQPPLPASEENDASFREIARDEELIEAGGSPSDHHQSDFPADIAESAERVSAGFPGKTPGDESPSPIKHREYTSFVIPGVSTNRIEFAAFSHTSDTTKVRQPEESKEPRSEKMAPLHAPVSVPHPREASMVDSEFLSRLEHLVEEGVKPRIDSETLNKSSMALSSGLVEQLGISNEEQGDTNVARRLARLQRVVSELSATVSSQVARNRNESQAQPRERKTPSPQRTVIIKSSDALSTTPRAFWERSRLGRLHLRTVR